jgi:anti-sigma regulatory factor (Ser/Thr protein kinase)
MPSRHCVVILPSIEPARVNRFRRLYFDERSSRAIPISSFPVSMLDIGPDWRAMVLAARPALVADCRNFVRVGLSCWHFPELIEDVTACTSELVTNAMRHGDGDFIGLILSFTTKDVLLEVFNRSSGEPFVHELEIRREYGRGLHIVQALSSSWGWAAVDISPGALGLWKRVWCSFNLAAKNLSEYRGGVIPS